MLFTEPGFLFLFLPLLLVAYYAAPRSLRNVVLLVASIYFYSVGERVFVLVMIASILFNYGLGRLLDAARAPGTRRWLLVVGIVTNLGALAVFKYADFVVRSINAALASAHLGALPLPHLHLPIGISFFTFHALSYLTDIYRGEVKAMRSLPSFSLYITLFPQLIAGPIIRYKLIARQFTDRRETLAGFSEGVRRFVLGFGKKMLIANVVARVADQIFAIPTAKLTPSVAWLGMVCYSLQIYFDFSGYSDMAVGLGRMFGFVFPENFNYPYAATSITDFWRRWHMTLSSWFSDYLYVPLGGNRQGAPRTYRNLLIVFFLCGLWHGASWSFVVWGLFHGGFLILERVRLGALLERLPRPVRHAYVVVVFMVGWVFFRADTLGQALGFLASAVGLGPATGVEYFPRLYWDPKVGLAIVAGLVGCAPFLAALARGARRLSATAASRSMPLSPAVGATLELVGVGAVFFLSVMQSAAGTYNPFIYFRF